MVELLVVHLVEKPLIAAGGGLGDHLGNVARSNFHKAGIIGFGGSGAHLLLADYDPRTIQKLLGHSDIKTTLVYFQTVPGVTLKGAKSPLDLDPSLAPCRGRLSV
jgi:integrase